MSTEFFIIGCFFLVVLVKYLKNAKRMEKKRMIMRSIRIPEELDNELKKMAENEDRSQNYIIQRILEEKLDSQKDDSKKKRKED